MSSLAPQIIDRLRAEVTSLNQVLGAASLAKVLDDGGRVSRPPVAYVMSLSEVAQPPQTTGPQALCTETIAVVLMDTSANDPRGDKADADLAPLLDAVVGALMGWQPTGAIDGLVYLDTQTIAARGSAVIRQIRFTGDYWRQPT